MNQIILEGTNLANIRLQVRDIDDAIEQLRKLQTNQNRINSIIRFKGIAKPDKTTKVNEEDWYAQ